MSQGQMEPTPPAAPAAARDDPAAAQDFQMPGFDSVAKRYLPAVAVTSAFLMIQLLLWAALAVALLWCLLVMLVEFPRAPIPCFWGAVLDLIVLLFLLKPAILRPAHQPSGGNRLVVSRHDEPRLYDFVVDICRRIGTRPPDCIVVTLDTTVRARTLMSGETELTLGLPLLSVFPLSLLTALLARELGHFRSAGTRHGIALISFFSRFIDRGLYDLDAVDLFLLRLRTIRNIYFMAAERVVFFLTESMRGLLWLLMVGGLWMIHRLRREMELAADRFAASLVGREEWLKALEAVYLVESSIREAKADVNPAMQERALPDDLVRLAVTDAVARARYKDEIFERMHTEETRWNSPHPCLTERIENIGDIDSSPRAHSEEAATVLLTDFRATCRQLTRQWYDERLGMLRKRLAMISSKKLTTLRMEIWRGRYRVRRYFRTGLGPFRRMLPTVRGLVRADDPADILNQLKDIRIAAFSAQDRLDIQSGPEFEALMERRTAIRTYIHAVDQVISMVYRVNRRADVRSLKRWRRELVPDAAQIEKHIGTLHDTVGPMDALSQRRLRLVMSLLHSPVPMRRDANLPRLRSRAAAIARRSDAVERVASVVMRMRERINRLDVLCRGHSPDVERLVAEDIHITATGIVSDIAEFCHEFKNRPELVKWVREQAANGRILPMAATDPTNLGELRRCAVAMWDYLVPMIEKLQAKTAGLAEDVESALGLDILPDPPRELESRRRENLRRAVEADQTYWFVNSLRAAGGVAAVVLIIHLVTIVIAR